MKNRTLLLVIIFAILSTFYIAEATSYKTNLIHYIAKQKNKIPRRYIAPTDTQVDLFSDAVHHLIQFGITGDTNERGEAARVANSVGYTLKEITHTNNLTYYILESTDPKYRPWGTYIFYLGSKKGDFVIEVPHPVEEKNTSRIGITAFEYTNSETMPTVFLMSGSRREAYDVTLDANSVFQAVHEEATSETPTTVVFQIHGFNRKRYPQIVLTSGTPAASQSASSIIGNLIYWLETNFEYVYNNIDFEVGVYDGIQYVDYGSTQNEQAKYTNSIGGSFIGIFLNQAVHNSKKQSDLVVDSIEQTINETTTP